MTNNNLKKVLLKVLLKIDIKNNLFYVIFNESLFYCLYTLCLWKNI